MPGYTQENRPLSISTPLGRDVLLLQGIQGVDAVSTPFRYTLDLLAEPQKTVAFERLLGEKVTVSIVLPDGSKRPINGVVSRLSQGARVPGPDGPGTFIRYQAEIVPQFWLLQRRTQSRIFQQLSVPDILAQVLAGVDFKSQIQGTFEPRDYCVQYRESDFNFASRLMEEEGIYYFFQHTAASHTMILANVPSSHPNLPGPSQLIYETVEGGTRQEDRVLDWHKTQELRSGKVTLWDSCFELPGKNLQADQTIQASVQVGKVGHKLQVGGNDHLELYDYPGGYAARFDGVSPGGGDRASDVQKIFQDNKRTAAIQMQREAAQGLLIDGDSSCRQLAAGYKFTLDRHPDANGSYVLTRVEHESNLGDSYTHGSGLFHYQNRFRCLPAALPYRPPPITPRPTIHGTQTAVVVGPSGQEIFTDKYGRVKVQFPWDRKGKNDANSSCWIRVASSWSGKQWGFVQIPRIGQEVVVAFEEGDPDRPLILGSVYNAEMMPPYALPDNMTRSGMKSRSSAKGTPTHFNEVVFEDKKGQELISVHAERDHARVVENNDSLKVGSSDSQTCPEGNQTISVYKDRTATIETGNEELTVKKGNRTVTIQEGDETHEVSKGKRTTTIQANETLTVNQGNREVTVKTGNDTHTVKTGNRNVTIEMGNDGLTIKMGNQTTKLNLGSSTTEALQGITLKVGPNSIQITPSGITIKGLTVSVQGQVQTQIKGLMCQVNGDAMLQLKGGITMIG